MQGVTSRGMLKPEEIDTVYSSEDVRIMQYGDTAVVAFVLVGKSANETKRFATAIHQYSPDQVLKQKI